MRRLLFLLVLSIHCFVGFAAVSYKDQWAKANNFYKQKAYDSAAYYYEQVAALHSQEAEVYYNLGNTYYRLNQIGPAVLNYERALHIRPSYKEAEDNLALTQSRIVNRIAPIQEIFFLNWWYNISAGHLAGTWAMISLMIFIVAIGLLIAKKFNKIPTLPVQVYLALGIVWIILLSFAIAASGNKADSGKAVVMETDVPMYTAPNQSKAQNMVPEGTTVELLGKKSTWAEVKLPDGRTGWVERRSLAKI
jgi:hypothetical protein